MYKRGLNTELHLAVDTAGRPLRALITKGSQADCKQAVDLIARLKAHHLVADRGYDSNEVISQEKYQKMRVVIPPKKNRKVGRTYDKESYQLRHLVENAFLHLKRWRGICTRYAKKASSFLAAIQIRCIALWADVL